MTQCRPTDGVIVAEGGSSGGFTLYAKEGKLIYEYNFSGEERTTIASDSDLPQGKVQVSMNYVQESADKNDPLAGGTVTLKINGNEVASGDVPRLDYFDRRSFEFNGRIVSLDVNLTNQ